MLTTWPALTEAIYLLGDHTGWAGQELLWALVFRDDLMVASLDDVAMKRSYVLMKKFRDLPMDLAAATLVALAESRQLSRIFTLDTDFRIYQIKGRKAFDVIP
jgi:predicted nucleic acid-binding protein